jgi:hypothetical protein
MVNKPGGGMSNPHHLFRLTHGLLNIAAACCAALAALLVLCLGGVAVVALNPDHLGVPDVLEGISRGQALAFATPLLLAGVACLGMTALAFRTMAQMVGSAMTGDPFVAENAARLMRTGWFLLGVQLVGILTHVVVGTFPEKMRSHFHFEFNASPMGLLAVLMIFVLAQVFRRGSEMRAELEGTV